MFILYNFISHTGKCTIGACNAIIPTYTAFQYPCVMRNLAVGVGNFAAGAALMIVPYLWLLVNKRFIFYLPSIKHYFYRNTLRHTYL